MASETQVLMRTTHEFADELRERAAALSVAEGRKVSIGECVERSMHSKSCEGVIGKFAALVMRLRDAASEVMCNWPAIDSLWLDISCANTSPTLVVEGDADFIIDSGLSVMQFGKMSRRMSESSGIDVIVTSQPRTSWCDAGTVDAYEALKVQVWSRDE